MLPFQLLPPCLRDAHPSLSFLLASLCFQHVPRSLHTSHLEGASLFFSYQLLAESLHSLFVPFFSLGNCCLYLLSPKKKIYIYIYENNTVVGSETLGIGPCKVGREFLIFITGLWYLLVALAHGVTVPWGREVRDPSPLPTGNAMGSLPAAPRSWSQSN